MGGLFTLGCVIVVSIITYSIIMQTVRKENHYVTERPLSFQDSIFSNMTFKQMTEMGLTLPTYAVGMYDTGGKICLNYQDRERDHR